MAARNNRKENTFRTKALPEAEFLEEQPIIEEKKKEEKPKKETKRGDKSSKGKEFPKNKAKKESDGRIRRIIGILFICLAVFLGIALISYLISFFSHHHQELGYQIFSQKADVDNPTGRLGFFMAQALIKESFGIGAFFFVYLLTLIGLRLTDVAKIKMWNVWKWALLCLVWLPLFFAFIATAAPKCAIFGGAVGLWLNTILANYVGNTGIIIILAFLFLVFAVYQFNLTLNYFKELREKREDARRHQAARLAEQQIKEQYGVEDENITNNFDDVFPTFTNHDEDDHSNLPPTTSYTKAPTFEIVNPDDNLGQQEQKENVFKPSEVTLDPTVTTVSDAKPQDAVPQKTDNEPEKVELVIEETPKEETVEKGKNMEHHTIDTPFDPRYELRDYKFPTLDMLNDYGGQKSEIDEEELNANKNKIVETLGNYGIAIDKIKATIGPTVTLYEIVPAAGIRIS